MTADLYKILNNDTYKPRNFPVDKVFGYRLIIWLVKNKLIGNLLEKFGKKCSNKVDRGVPMTTYRSTQAKKNRIKVIQKLYTSTVVAVPLKPTRCEKIRIIEKFHTCFKNFFFKIVVFLIFEKFDIFQSHLICSPDLRPI